MFESSVNTNVQLRNHMWGCNDFMVSGVLKDYERMPYLSECKVRTLITVGEYDFISPATCKTYADSMDNAKLVIIPDASHNSHLEQPKLYSDALQLWLR
ncbi:MAG TPA: hypothetical protein DEO98_06965 [Legionellales bacterium]|nr:hypothetical protein [Legionellales bacterium]|tara:strand:+ start:2628 stop:2924 length:297 start_codon:yes stop_codon:yes gene_type:complete